MCDERSKLFSTVTIAAAMNVGESSIKRWIDSGTLGAEKTPGGHRRVAASDFYRFLRSSGRNLVHPEKVGLDKVSSAPSKAPAEVCLKSLEAGDGFQLESALQMWTLSSPGRASLLDAVVYPTYKQLRATCQHPSEECMVLHRALSITQAALNSTMPANETIRTGKGPKIVFADIGYEVDGIPTWLAEAAVSDRAKCLQLGANVPATVVEGALGKSGADVLWVSASGPVSQSLVAKNLSGIISRADKAKVRTVVFGDALPRKLAGQATRVTSFSEFRGFVLALAD